MPSWTSISALDFSEGAGMPSTCQQGRDENGPASGENTSHLCRLRILGYFGLDPPNRGSGLLGNKLISVQKGWCVVSNLITF